MELVAQEIEVQGVIQYSTVQYSTVQYSTVQCSTVQCSVLHTAVCCVVLILPLWTTNAHGRVVTGLDTVTVQLLTQYLSHSMAQFGS